MKVLIIGSGGREHAIGWKISQSPQVEKIYFAPGNGGTHTLGENIDIAVDDTEKLLDFAKEYHIDMTVVGPERPLEVGVVDVFRENGLAIFGPDSQGATLETSKSFAKKFLEKYDIPTARYEVYHTYEEATEALEHWSFPLVIKADGLADGKGVFICEDKAQAVAALHDTMQTKTFGDAGNKVVMEEFLIGREASLLCFVDGKTIVPMESASDYKRAKDGNQGLNTGGMGSVSPAFHYTPEMGQEIIQKTLYGIQQEGFDYRGVIYIGLMMTEDGAKVLEYNVRFGDPETEALMPRLESDLLEIMKQVEQQTLAEAEIIWKKESCVSVVVSSGGYPESYAVGYTINHIPEETDNMVVFHGGTIMENETCYTNGGRVLMVSALGEIVEKARELAYQNVPEVKFQDSFYRKDIGVCID